MFRPTTFTVYTDVPQRGSKNEANVNSENATQKLSPRERSRVSKTQRLGQSKENKTRPKTIDHVTGQKPSDQNAAIRARSVVQRTAGQAQAATTKQHDKQVVSEKNCDMPVHSARLAANETLTGAPVKRGLRNVSNVGAERAGQPDSSRVFKKPAAVIDKKATVGQQRTATAKSLSSAAVQNVIADFAQLRTVAEAAETRMKPKVQLDSGKSKSVAAGAPVHKKERDASNGQPALAGAERGAAVKQAAISSIVSSSPSARPSQLVAATSKRRRVSQLEPADDRFLAPDFAEQMYAHLRLTEHRHLQELMQITQAFSRTSTKRHPDSGWSGLNGNDLLALQTDVTSVHRLILVDWLVDVCGEFALSNDTLHLAVHLADRYLAQSNVARSRYQLVAAAGLCLAAKFEETEPPNCRQLSHITADAFTSEQIRKFEALLFSEMRFKVHTVTSRTFAEYLLYAVGIREWNFDSADDQDEQCKATPTASHSSDKTARSTADRTECNTLHFRLLMFAEFLLELALLDATRFFRFANSLLATAAVYLAVQSTSLLDVSHAKDVSKSLGASVKTVCAALLRAAGYDASCVALGACIREMHFVARSYRALYATTHNLEAIVRKYAQPEFGCVSSILPAPLDSIELAVLH